MPATQQLSAAFPDTKDLVVEPGYHQADLVQYRTFACYEQRKDDTEDHPRLATSV